MKPGMHPLSLLSGIISGLVFYFSIAVVARAEVITFQWSHNEVGAVGYKLYKSSDQQNWVEVANIVGAANKSTQHDKTTDTIECFGITAYSASAQESTMTTKTSAGEDVCLGKPIAPTAFSFSAP